MDLLVFTHIDEDHILGGVSFFVDNIDNKNGRVIKVNEVWFNTYRHLQLEKHSSEVTNKMVVLNEKIKKNSNSTQNSLSKGVSAFQASSLGALILGGEYKWNTSADANGNSAICLESIPEKNINDVKIILLSPAINDLNMLQTKWIDMLKKKNYREKIVRNRIFDDAYEFLINNEYKKIINKLSKPNSGDRKFETIESYLNEVSKEDTSLVNRTSISFIIEFGGKKILFLSDIHPSLVEEKIKKIYSDELKSGPVIFDAIKVSHHGSKYNTRVEELLQIVDSHNYLFSTNGDMFCHPDLETISRIILNRNIDIHRKLYFNYPCEEIFKNRKDELLVIKNICKNEKYNCSINDSVSEEGIQWLIL